MSSSGRSAQSDEHAAGREDWHAHVMRSPLDARVWCAILPDADMMTGALHASTSLRRAKKYAETEAVNALFDRDPDALTWVRAGDEWVLVERRSRPGKEQP